MNINKITEYILKNYDETSENLIRTLREIDCDLFYNGLGLEDAIFNKKTYSCSIRLRTKRNKIFDTVFPIMIGSKLDTAVRKLKITEFETLEDIPNLLGFWDEGDKEFEDADIAITCFLINGLLKQIPFYITNDSSNVHISKQNIARVYRYDSEEKGKQLSMYFDSVEKYKRGDLVMKFNNGNSLRFDPTRESFREVNDFFECPHNVKPKVYFREVFSEGFRIDDIDNKIVISAGHIFYKLFKKTLYVPLKTKNISLIRKKHNVVVKSIEQGDLLHIISKKTVFHREINLRHKMVNVSSRMEIQREIGENDEIFMEKKTTCYRDVNCQIYPYFPYLSHHAQFQISDKVKTTSILAFNNSFKGFLCIYGTSEGKNVGRNMALTKDTFVSTGENVEEVYRALNLEEGSDGFYVVVNTACIEVSKSCFEGVNLTDLKRRFTFIECFERDRRFKFVTLKVGLLFKKLEEHLWVTSRDIHYWMKKLYDFDSIDQLIESKGNDFIIGHGPDIIRYYAHNLYSKNILTLNTLKNGILATTPRYSLYFLETISAYSEFTVKHRPILEPENSLSKHYVMYLPRLNLMYASFKGSTQEDCIAVHKDVRAFDCHRLYTVKIKFGNESSKYFHEMRGPPNPADTDTFLGTIVCPTNEINVLSQTMHLKLRYVKSNIVQVYFTKPRFQVVRSRISETHLFVCIERFHKFSFGDKLCSLHGQKGVGLIFDSLPRSVYRKVDLIINPYALTNRQTMGMVRESLAMGGRDYDCLRNSDGEPLCGKAFIGPIHYFAISYLACEHGYLAVECVRDKIAGHYIRGRSRNGGMKTGTMEFFNCIVGNGIAACCEEKLLEHSDRIILNGIPIPKSVVLCKDDASCHKSKFTYETRECIVDEKGGKIDETQKKRKIDSQRNVDEKGRKRKKQKSDETQKTRKIDSLQIDEKSRKRKKPVPKSDETQNETQKKRKIDSPQIDEKSRKRKKPVPKSDETQKCSPQKKRKIDSPQIDEKK